MDHIITSVLIFIYSSIHTAHSVLGLQFTEQPNDYVIAMDHSLWWHCRAVGTGTVKYSWRFQDGFLTSSPSTGVTIFTNGTLHIRKITDADFGLYQCKVEDALSFKFSKYATLKKAYMADIFKESPTPTKKYVGNTGTFHCAIDSLPFPIITWELNNQPLKDGAVSMVTETRSRLVFSSIDYDNAGDLRCLAKNTALQTLKYSQVASLTVEGRPFLKVPPEPTSAVVGSSVSFQCLAIGVPEPTVEWTLQGSSKKLSNSNKYLVHPNGTLQILNIQFSDQNFYVCTAKNSYGPNIKTVSLDVEGDLGRPSINYTSTDATILLGRVLTLRCQASGNPRPSISWSKDRSTLPAKRTTFPYSGEVKIFNVQGNDSGTYICTAGNSKGSASRPIGVTVYSIPSFTATPTNAIVNKGNPATLKCSATAFPKPPAISWKTPNSGSLSSQNATGQNGISITASGDLMISSALQVHTGKYKCIAKNGFGSVTAEAYLTVYVKPTITKAPVDQKVSEGSSPLIPCTAMGYPSPVVTWSQYSQTQEVPVINGRVFKIHSNGSLTIINVKKRHSGSYKCVARNSVGDAQGMMTLAVLVAPVFKYTPPNMIVTLGDTVLLPCAARGDPTPTVSWMRGGKALVLDSNMILHGNHSLSITGVTKAQLGEYTCVAKNDLLSITATGSIHLKDVPVFSMKPANTTVNATMVTELPCSAAAREPPMYLWYTSDENGNKGRLLQPGISQTGQGASAMVSTNGTLVIKQTSQEDEGWYLCVAKNSAGEAKHSAYLNVQEPPRITSTNSPQEVSANQSVTLTCQSQGDPAPILSWKSPSSAAIISSSTTEYVLDGASLKVSKVEVKEHFGKWTCFACNDLGCANRSVLLDVIGRPVINFGMAIAKGTKLIITCQAVGLPAPSIKYYKDNIEITATNFPNHKIVGGSLEIDNPASDTIYKCTATNGNGQDMKNFTVPTIPDPPSKPKVSNVLSNSVTLTWTDGEANSSPIIAYYVYYMAIGATAKSKVKMERSPTVISGLLPFTSYRFEVQTENGVGPGLIGPVSLTVKTKEAAPGPPENVVPSYGKYSISLSWLAPQQLNGDPANIEYSITHAVINSTTSTTVLIDSRQPRIYKIDNLERKLTYRVTLKAGNKKIQKWSKGVIVEKSLQETPPAEYPTLSESGIKVTGHDSISLSWKALDPVYGTLGYIISYSKGTNRRRKRAAEEKRTTNTNYNLTGLDSGTSYSLQVAAYNKHGTGPFSNRYSVTTSPEPLAVTSAITLGALIGIIIGCVLFVLLIIVIISYCCVRHKRRKQKQRDLLYSGANGGQASMPRQLKIPKGMETYYNEPEKRKPPKSKQAKQTKPIKPEKISHKRNRTASGFYDLTSAIYDNAGFYDPPDEYYPQGIVETSHKSQSVKINAKDSDVFFKRKPTIVKKRSRDPDVVLLSKQPITESSRDPMELHVPLPPPRAVSPHGSIPRMPAAQSEYELHEIIHESDRVPYPPGLREPEPKSILTKKNSDPMYEEIGAFQSKASAAKKPMSLAVETNADPPYTQVNAEHLAAKRREKEHRKRMLKRAELDWEKRHPPTTPQPPAKNIYKKRSETYSTVSGVTSERIPDSHISSDQEENDVASVRVSGYHHGPDEADTVSAAMF